MKHRSISVLSFAMAFVCFTLAGMTPENATAVPVTVVYSDGATEGFNDPTLGAARRAAFEYGLNVWANALQGTVTVVVDAQFNPLGTGLLGQAGASTSYTDFPNTPQAGTWYPVALANQYAGSDLNGANVEIEAEFSTNFTFYYGLDGNPGVGEFDFVSVVLHEFCHGFGYFSLIDKNTGALALGFPAKFDRWLLHQSVGQLTSLTNGQRLTAITSNNLYWNGPNLSTVAGGNVKMYAPATVVPGSSVSHFDTSLTPNELMEPSYTGPNHDPGFARYLLEDIDWNLLPTPTPTSPPVPVSAVNNSYDYR